MMRQMCLALALIATFLAATGANAQPVGIALAGDRSSIYVAGRVVRFENLATTRGQLVVRADDSGLQSMLDLIGARLQYQPGTRFVVFTRADGKLVTFTVGSNAVTVDDTSLGIPFGPFYDGDHLYIPLLALCQALGLSERGFQGGYAFAPQIVSVSRRVGQRRTVLEIQATAPLTWRAAYGGDPKKPMLVITFSGFSNAAGNKVELGGREAKTALIEQQGPPGFPITAVTLDALHGVKFAAHRTSSCTMDLILAREDKYLALGAVTAATPSVSLSATPSSQVTAPPQNSPVPTAIPEPAASAPEPSAVPAPEVTDSGSLVTPQGSPSPLASGASPQANPSAPPVQKIVNVTQTDAAGVSRITLTLTGPVNFEWHRLADPDNRFWIDVSQAELVGPAENLVVKLGVIRSVTISQNELTPDHVVRIAIDPTQPVDVAIGAIEGTPNALGIDIRSSPPPADAPSSGVGALISAPPTPQPAAFSTYVPADPKLIVIDPGHGGNDPGAINESMGLTEKNLTLSISKRLKADLERAGWHVTLTRDGDYEVGDPGGNDKQELQARCDIANAAGARLFISVHINASVSSDPSGITTYFWRDGSRSLAQAVQGEVVKDTGAGDAGVIRNNFYVIHHTVMPAVLVEAAYLSNDHDARLLSQQSFLDHVADGIAQGVKDFTGGPPPK